MPHDKEDASVNQQNQEEMQTFTDDNEPCYAGFGMRMLASIIDTILSAIFLVPLFNLVADIMGILEPAAMQNLSPEELQAALLEILRFNMIQLAIMGVIVVIFWIWRAATPGKMLLKMRIVDANTGKPPSTSQYITRFFGYIPATIPLGIGLIWIYYDKRHQGWHDKMAGTVVVYDTSKKEMA